MSGRKGLGVKANDLSSCLVEEARRRSVGNEMDAAPADPSESRSHRRSVGALRYFMLKFGRNKVIAFDFDEALSFEETPGPTSVLGGPRRKHPAQTAGARLPAEIDADALAGEAWEDDLWEIFVEVARIDDVVDRAVDSLEIAAVARHAYALAQSFSRFYHRHPIAQESDARVRNRRLATALAFRDGLAKLLALLGIPSPEKM
jgi:arginyl-tRNA synthetase